MPLPAKLFNLGLGASAIAEAAAGLPGGAYYARQVLLLLDFEEPTGYSVFMDSPIIAGFTLRGGPGAAFALRGGEAAQFTLRGGRE